MKLRRIIDKHAEPRGVGVTVVEVKGAELPADCNARSLDGPR